MRVPSTAPARRPAAEGGPAASPAGAAGPPAPLAARRPRAVLLAVIGFLAVTLSLYVGRRTFVHEEARRSIVAQEMVFSGDLLAPTVFEKPYFKKPPFHNWLIALTALPTGIVGERGARTVSLVALLALGVAVYALVRRERPELAPAAALMTLTTYLAGCEYGNLAEPDMLLALLGVLSYSFYLDSSGRPGRLLLSATFMGLGILTKGVLPLFFYPGLLVRALADGETAAVGPGASAGRRREVGRLALHLLLALVLPALWAAALWLRGDLGALLATGAAEVAIKTTGPVVLFLRHLLTFPLRIVLSLLPWSAAVVWAWRRSPGRTALYRDSFWIALLSLGFFVLASGSRDRYILPAVPFLAVLGAHHFDGARPVPRRLLRPALACLALACLAGGVAGMKMGYVLQAAILCATAALALALAWRPLRWLDFALAVALIMVMAFEHGIYYYRAMNDNFYDPLVARIGERVRADVPLVLDEHARLIHLGFYLEAGLERPLRARSIAPAERHYLIAPVARPDSTGRVLLRLAHPHETVGEILLQDVPAREGRPSPPAR